MACPTSECLYNIRIHVCIYVCMRASMYILYTFTHKTYIISRCWPTLRLKAYNKNIHSPFLCGFFNLSVSVYSPNITQSFVISGVHLITLGRSDKRRYDSLDIQHASTDEINTHYFVMNNEQDNLFGDLDTADKIILCDSVEWIKLAKDMFQWPAPEIPITNQFGSTNEYVSCLDRLLNQTRGDAVARCTFIS
jgi:hypothetical protein